MGVTDTPVNAGRLISPLSHKEKPRSAGLWLVFDRTHEHKALPGLLKEITQKMLRCGRL